MAYYIFNVRNRHPNGNVHTLYQAASSLVNVIKKDPAFLRGKRRAIKVPGLIG